MPPIRNKQRKLSSLLNQSATFAASAKCYLQNIILIHLQTVGIYVCHINLNQECNFIIAD
jgi:hypothetical protein